MKRRFAVAAVLAVATLGACGSDDDVSPDTLTDALVNQGLERSIAECISNELSSQLSTDDFNRVAVAQTADDMSPELQDLVLDVTTDCVLADEG